MKHSRYQRNHLHIIVTLVVKGNELKDRLKYLNILCGLKHNIAGRQAKQYTKLSTALFKASLGCDIVFFVACSSPYLSLSPGLYN